jgi:S1-C subfamily serine protease
VDALDIILILVVIAAAVHGVRLGAAVQILSFAGALIGVVIGVILVISISPHVHGRLPKTLVALVMLLVPAAAIWALGRQLGARAWKRLRGNVFGKLDSATGAVIAIAGTLVVVWILSSVLVNTQVTLVSTQIQDSGVIRAVDRVLPPVPNEIATVERLLGQNGFPLPYIGLRPSAGPVGLPTKQQFGEAVSAAGQSTVKILALGCGNLVQYGSGFVVAPGFVVTNAHVVAGTNRIEVIDQTEYHQTTLVLFDPEYDLAILRVPTLTDPPLTVDPNYVGRGVKGAVLGYPGGGSFTAVPAGVLLRFYPLAPDIYGNNDTQRQIYEIQATVRPGNSGGPLVEPSGEVIGVVFSRDASNPDIGFALASPGVLSRIHEAEARPAGSSVGSGHCISG